MSLILNRLKELEEETGEPERREIAKRRKKQLKEIQSFLQDRSKTAEDRTKFLHARMLAQVPLFLLPSPAALPCPSWRQ